MTAADENERSEIEELLPWHAAGTLDRHDAERVEAALARDPELARRYQLVRDELGQTVYLNETLGAPSPRALDVLLAKIDAEPARRPRMAARLGARIGAFFESLTPRTLAWSASAAALAIVLQAGIIAGVIIKGERGADYQTASANNPADAGKGSYALIRFQPQATAGEITRFLETNKLSVAAGPLGGGLYRVRVSESVLSKPDLAGRVKALQDDKIIAFIAVTD